MKRLWSDRLCLAVCFHAMACSAHAQTLASAGLESVVVTARLRPEEAQNVPVSLSVVDSNTLAVTRTDNLQQLQFLAPSLNYGSPNPRNTSVTIRGLGSSGQRQLLGRHGAQELRGFLDQHLFADAALVGRPADPASFFLANGDIRGCSGALGPSCGLPRSGCGTECCAWSRCWRLES